MAVRYIFGHFRYFRGNCHLGGEEKTSWVRLNKLPKNAPPSRPKSVPISGYMEYWSLPLPCYPRRHPVYRRPFWSLLPKIRMPLPNPRECIADALGQQRGTRRGQNRVWLFPPELCSSSELKSCWMFAEDWLWFLAEVRKRKYDQSARDSLATERKSSENCYHGLRDSLYFGVNFHSQKQSELRMGAQGMEFLFQLSQPLRSQMNVFQQNPSARFVGAVYRFVRLTETFRRS